MNDFALQEELEALAGNAYNPDLGCASAAKESMAQTIERWQRLFQIPDDNAAELIISHRNDLTRMRISDGHWETVKAAKTSAGYDREAYEYELNLGKKKAVAPNLLPWSDDASSVTYLIELAGPLETPGKVAEAARTTQALEVVTGRSVEDGRSVWLCSIDGGLKNAILQWVAHQDGDFEPTILVDPRSLR